MRCSAQGIDVFQRIIKSRKFNIDEKVARSRISRKKAQGFSQGQPTSTKARSIDRQEFGELFEAYEHELDSSNRLDYDDLLLRCQQLLKVFPVCVSNVETVLIDEFQDTNTVQYELMRLFASRHKRITIVGDPDQSIYGFRSAEIKNLTRMRVHYPETTTIILEENYRSCGAILRAAQNVIEQDTARPSKSLQATHAYGTLPALRKLPSATAEAAWTVFEIQRAIAMTGGMLTHSDFAILLRSAHLSRQIESAMGKAGIPYQMVGGCRFYDRLEIRILLDYLKVIYQPNNNEAMLAILNVPARKLGDKTREIMLAEAKEKGCALFDFMRQISLGRKKSKARLSKPAEQGLSSLILLILSGRETLKCLTPAADAPKVLLDYLIKTLSFKKYLEDTHIEDFDSRWANVEELSSQAVDVSTYADEQFNSEALPQIEGIEQTEANNAESVLSLFLANISLSSQADAIEDNVSQPKVTISTIHAAKGLEWPVVFVPALYNGSIPHSRAEDTDEERRLLYVAMTRAQALLYMSQPLHQSSAQGLEETVLSSFVTPRSADKFFQATGSNFSDELVRTIANTLRRSLPSTAGIVQASEKLRSIEDDLWPVSGERGHLDSVLYEDMTFGRLKRKLDEGTSSTVRSLLDKSENGSINTRSFLGDHSVTIGFTTAADHLRTQPPSTILAPTANTSSEPHAPAPKPTKRFKATASTNQPTIASLFGRKSTPHISETTANYAPGLVKTDGAEPSLPISIKTVSTVSSQLLQQGEEQQVEAKKPQLLPRFSSHRLPSSKTELPKQNHRPKPVLDETNTNIKAYCFLSSSPLRETESEPTESKSVPYSADRRAAVAVAVATDENKFCNVAKKMTADAVASRPAATFHSSSTSMAQLQQSKQGSSYTTMVKQRRRYGMGGGMMAWRDRKNR